jgi:hypothetical protein
LPEATVLAGLRGRGLDFLGLNRMRHQGRDETRLFRPFGKQFTVAAVT